MSSPKIHGVSIHAFRGEGDSYAGIDAQNALLFQSTPSGGKATRVQPPTKSHRAGFNPRLPGGRRQFRSVNRINGAVFQSTPSGGKATELMRGLAWTGSFQSTPSGGKATGCAAPTRCACSGFNPRLPGGRRLQYLGLLCPVPARYCSMIRIFRVALGTICPYIRFLRCC